MKLGINSISARLLLAMAVVLSSFVVVIFLSLQHAVNSRLEQAQHDTMQGLVYGILGAAELNAKGELVINELALPDRRLQLPQSGLQAAIFNSDNQAIWQSESKSYLGRKEAQVRIGRWRFIKKLNDTNSPYFNLRFGFSWSNPGGEEQEFNLLLIESADEHLEQVQTFNRQLWWTLLAASLLLLTLQLIVLLWSLRPLGKMSRALKLIRRGKKVKMDTRLPRELQPVATSLNALLQSERNRQKQYRNVIDDLAHSLKTPLSVIHNMGQDKQMVPEQGDTLLEQSRRMTDIIAYHTRRASVSGSRPLGLITPIKPLVKRLQASLSKVYAERHIQFELQLDEKIGLRMDEADMMEIFGNLLENACKYGASNILVSGTENSKSGEIRITIEDDGPGFPEGYGTETIERGRRADTRVEGQGIGLAISSELIASHAGRLQLGISEKLQGAKLSLYFSATI